MCQGKMQRRALRAVAEFNSTKIVFRFSLDLALNPQAYSSHGFMANRTDRNLLQNRSRHYDVWHRGHGHPGIEILIHLWYHFMSNCFNSLLLRYNLLIVLDFYVKKAV